MPKNSEAWFVVADAGRGRLLRCARVAHGRIHVDEHGSVENRVEEHEHGRPSPRSGKSGKTYASGGHEDEYRIHRFAKEVTAWLEKALARHRCETLALFAAPRFLGELRKTYGHALATRIREHQADLTHLDAAGLAKHPAIEELLTGR